MTRKPKGVSNDKPNVVLLTVDGLRSDHLNIYGYSRQTNQTLEPYLDHMATFKNAYTYSPATIRSFAAILCSIWPDLCMTKYVFEYIKKAWLPAFCRTLPEVFQSAGYYTAAHTCWVNYLTDRQGFGRGFSDFYGFLRQDGTQTDGRRRSLLADISRYAQYSLRFIPSYRFVKAIESQFHWVRETINILGFNIEEAPGTSRRSGIAVTNHLLNRIRQHAEEPFFIWGHYLDAHIPFSPPEEFAYRPGIDPKTKRALMNAIFHRQPVSKPFGDVLIDLYDGEIRSAFHQIRRVFDDLKGLGVLEKTCIVITADHGQGFWEHEYWECPDDMFFDESVQIPLLIYNSRLLPKQVFIETPVSLIDLAPTLVELCNLPSEKRFFGKSFAGLLHEQETVPTNNEIWIETLGPPRRCCQILNGKKVVYDLDSASFLYGLDTNDQLVPIEQTDRLLFGECLQNYQDDKEQFLKRVRGE